VPNILETFAHLFHPRRSNNHRPRILHPEGFLLLFVIAGALALVVHQSPLLLPNESSILGYSSSINSVNVIQKTNETRKKQGLTELRHNPVLSKAATAKAENMFQEQYWAHYSPAGKGPWDFMKTYGYSYSVAGENLARDFLETDDMMVAWMNSPTHRENIVNPKYSEIGIAVVDGVLNGVETTLVVQMFGTPLQTANKPQLDVAGETTIETVPFSEQLLAQSDAQLIVQQNTEVNTDIQPDILALSLKTLRLEQVPPILSPLHILKAFFLAIILLVILVLVYDTIVVNDRKTVRFVGKNLAHISLFLSVFFLVLLFKSGLVG